MEEVTAFFNVAVLKSAHKLLDTTHFKRWACIPSPTRKEWSLLLWWLAPRARLQDQVLRDLDREICHGGADEGLDRGSIGCRRLRGGQLDAKNTGAPAPSLFKSPHTHT